MARRSKQNSSPSKKRRFKVTRIEQTKRADKVENLKSWAARMAKERGLEVSVIIGPAVPHLVDIAKFARLVNRPLEDSLDRFIGQVLTILAEEAAELHDVEDVIEIRDHLIRVRSMFEASLEIRSVMATEAETALDRLAMMLKKKYPMSGP